MIQAVVYTSNTGSTEQYARLLGQETDLPVCSLAEARKTLSTGTQIVYLGWVMAGSIQGYADAARLFQIPMVCAVGMEPDAKQQELREKNGIPQDAALFALQGGYSPDRLHGLQKLMMRMFTGSMVKKLAAKADRTPGEDDLLDLMQHGGSRVSPEKLTVPLKWCREHLGGARHE